MVAVLMSIDVVWNSFESGTARLTLNLNKSVGLFHRIGMPSKLFVLGCPELVLEYTSLICFKYSLPNYWANHSYLLRFSVTSAVIF